MDRETEKEAERNREEERLCSAQLLDMSRLPHLYGPPPPATSPADNRHMID